MDIEKTRKISGIILLIKSFVLLLTTFIFVFYGIKLLVEANKITNDLENNANSGIDCSGLSAAISQILGIILIICAIVLVVFFIIYFINARKILYSKPFPKVSIILMLVFEIVCIFSSIYIIIMLVESISGIGTILFLILMMILLIQSIITIILLIKSLDINKKVKVES